MAAKIPYYVTKNYATDFRDYYQGSLAQLEVEVKLAYACRREDQERKYLFNMVNIESITETPRSFIGKSELEKAENSPHRNSPNWHDWYLRAKSMETPSCAKLELLIKNDHFSNIPNYFHIIAKFLFS